MYYINGGTQEWTIFFWFFLVVYPTIPYRSLVGFAHSSAQPSRSSLLFVARLQLTKRLRLVFFLHSRKFLYNKILEAMVKREFTCVVTYKQDWNPTTITYECFIYILVFHYFVSRLLNGYFRMTSIKVKVCRTPWGPILNTSPQSLSYIAMILKEEISSH